MACLVKEWVAKTAAHSRTASATWMKVDYVLVHQLAPKTAANLRAQPTPLPTVATGMSTAFFAEE